MIETITSWVDGLAQWIDKLPVEVVAILAGVLIGACATQWIKRTFPLTVMFGVSKEVATMLIRIIAFLLSFLPTFYIWQGSGAIWAALFSGFATPSLYRLASFFLYKRFPKLEARLSGTTEEIE